MSSIFTPEQIDTLSAEIDNQLRKLRTESDGTIKGEPGEPDSFVRGITDPETLKPLLEGQEE